ncbi:MAG: 3-oxoacyl-[acyl-carrier-protein] reductase [Acidobacteria bacterium]|nr:3-oxoacyl-[acyl-carrier-protein] reductase [Acidobacteriota bacterium]MBI3426181.1 3-oxoacyl-[acyl-carrier-protein] reductase [Acidobacteriota bacterium]
MLNLNGQIALVTGGSQGIGRATALVLADCGADVAVLARSLDKCEAVAEEIRAKGRRALAVRGDLGNAEEIKAAIERVAKELGPINILVNNAAITRDGLLLRMKREDWETVIQTNLTGVFLATQQVLPMMTKARKGRIINLTSVVAQAGNAGQVNYISAKAGLIGFTKAVAREYASRNITVNAVAPGFIETPMTAVLNEAARTALLEQIPLKRPGTDLDVAHAVAFLASDEAGYITGQVINVNGGMYM